MRKAAVIFFAITLMAMLACYAGRIRDLSRICVSEADLA